VKVAKKEGMKTLREDAWDKVLQGVTTYQEVIRVTGEESAV
jgi:type II secretory ATPase GspE/PulE/Tfp pilus assembly ATPase PilB-like protein